jgi:hypothetical protein
MSKHFQLLLKLRHNIDLEGDVTLAKMEIEALVGQPPKPLEEISRCAIFETAEKVFGGPGAASQFLRDDGIKAYELEASTLDLERLIKRSSFLQNIYFRLPKSGNGHEIVEGLERSCGDVLHWMDDGEHLVVNAVPHYALIELSDPVARRANHREDVRNKLEGLLNALKGKSGSDTLRFTEKAIGAKNTTSHLSHDIHYYKAKFFPRLARAALNVSSMRLDVSTPRVVDNFVGSGTTLLEASILGMPSLGIDIDPLSALIAKTKIEVMLSPPDEVAEKADRVLDILESLESGQGNLFNENDGESRDYSMRFPAWLMKNSNMDEEKARDLIGQINKVRRSIDRAGLHEDSLMRTIMSDAIARKIKMRFLGTGVGRFSLRFTKASIPQSFSKALRKYVRVVEAIDWVKSTLKIELADAEILQGDTRSLSERIGEFDVLLTSPPYLPAASGRESYSKARAPSLIALGMEDEKSVNNLIDGVVGSMKKESVDRASLTDEELDLVEWLENDDLRNIKAEPTARYFEDMRKTFQEMHKLLKPGGLAIMVSGKQSTFYEFESRETLYVVESADLLAEEARISGFEVEKLQDVKLQKSNRNARPRSLDDYYETLIYLREPIGDADIEKEEQTQVAAQ